MPEPRIGLVGPNGRMGRAIAALLDAAPAGVGRGGDVRALARGVDVLIDFSTPGALADTLDAAVTAGVPVLVGTTGLDAAAHRAIDGAAGTVAVLQTGNTSLGITLLARLAAEAARALGPGWDAEIVEAHHRMKRDAPSGTALLLAEAIAEATARSIDTGPRDGARADGAIGFAVVRGGSIVGDHDVLLLGPGEQLRLCHRAEDRAVFAHGAIAAARWLVGRPAGRYVMADVLGA